MKAPQPGAQPTTLKVRVLRSFLDHRREILKPGSEAELPRVFALEMAAANKVAILKEPEAPPAPAPVAPVAALSEEKPRGTGDKKGVRNAA